MRACHNKNIAHTRPGIRIEDIFEVMFTGRDVTLCFEGLAIASIIPWCSILTSILFVSLPCKMDDRQKELEYGTYLTYLLTFFYSSRAIRSTVCTFCSSTARVTWRCVIGLRKYRTYYSLVLCEALRTEAT